MSLKTCYVCANKYVYVKEIVMTCYMWEGTCVWLI
jgi:hypothetical protein